MAPETSISSRLSLIPLKTDPDGLLSHLAGKRGTPGKRGTGQISGESEGKTRSEWASQSKMAIIDNAPRGRYSWFESMRGSHSTFRFLSEIVIARLLD
jgi:hypothetical protein